MQPEERDASDLFWMERALGVAALARDRGEVPIGCVLVRGGKLLASSHDGKEVLGDPTAHAEILTLRAAAHRIGDWRLEGAEMYVTLEPCPMCAGALLHSRISRLIYGATNPRWGACGESEPWILTNPRFNHRVMVRSGVLETRCGDLLKETFRSWRRQT
jgi:tRNA(adenine34) deaminase